MSHTMPACHFSSAECRRGAQGEANDSRLQISRPAISSGPCRNVPTASETGVADWAEPAGSDTTDAADPVAGIYRCVRGARSAPLGRDAQCPQGRQAVGDQRAWTHVASADDRGQSWRTRAPYTLSPGFAVSSTGSGPGPPVELAASGAGSGRRRGEMMGGTLPG